MLDKPQEANYTPPSLAPQNLRDHGGRAVSRSPPAHRARHLGCSSIMATTDAARLGIAHLGQALGEERRHVGCEGRWPWQCVLIREWPQPGRRRPFSSTDNRKGPAGPCASLAMAAVDCCPDWGDLGPFTWPKWPCRGQRRRLRVAHCVWFDRSDKCDKLLDGGTSLYLIFRDVHPHNETARRTDESRARGDERGGDRETGESRSSPCHAGIHERSSAQTPHARRQSESTMFADRPIGC